MTTIAYKDGLICCDSRATEGSRIVDDNFNKCRMVDGCYFFVAGSWCEGDKLIDGYFGGEVAESTDAEALVYNTQTKELHQAGIDKHGFWKDKLEQNKPYSMGSGSSYAYAAMDLGCSAKEAVKAAMKRDSLSGGKVRTFKLK